MINTLGGRAGGHGFYLLKGKPVFAYNLLAFERFRWEGQEALTPGKHTVVFDFKYDGPGFGKGGTDVLSVDGKEVASKTIPHTIPVVATIDESFDVGVDTRTGVDDNDHQPPYRFTGKDRQANGPAPCPLNAAGKSCSSKRPKTREKQGTVSRSASVVRLYLNCGKKYASMMVIIYNREQNRS